MSNKNRNWNRAEAEQLKQAAKESSQQENPVPEQAEEDNGALAEPVLVEEEKPVQEKAVPVAAAPQPAKPTSPPPIKKEEARIVRGIELELINYLEAVHPSKIVSEQHGADWQYSLLKSLKKVLETPDPETFKTQWKHVLGFVHQHSQTLFNENYMYRFQNHWKGSAKEFTVFRHLTYLLMRTANPTTRTQNLRDIVLDRITSNLTPQAANNLLAFYS